MTRFFFESRNQSSSLVNSDPHAKFPHTWAKQDQFENVLRVDLGVENDDQIILYDSHGLFSCARQFYQFIAFGHAPERVAILDGGLPRWRALGYALEKGPPADVESSHYNTRPFDTSLTRSFDDVRRNEDAGNELVVDARSADRFHCRVDEPRADTRRGHIPNAVNVPFSDVAKPPHNELRDNDELRALFGQVGVHANQLTMFSCGSGVTACVSAFAAYVCGASDRLPPIYDGSWTEYAALTKTD